VWWSHGTCLVGSDISVNKTAPRDKPTFILVSFLETARAAAWSVQYGPTLFVNGLIFWCKIGV
jgi:hypothetical protein